MKDENASILHLDFLWRPLRSLRETKLVATNDTNLGS